MLLEISCVALCSLLVIDWDSAADISEVNPVLMLILEVFLIGKFSRGGVSIFLSVYSLLNLSESLRGIHGDA